MDNNRLLILLNKYQSNACTEQELQELEQWYSTLNTGNQLIDTTDAFANEMLLQFRQRLSEQTTTIPFYRKRLFRIAAAASILLIIGLGTAALVGVFTNKKPDALVRVPTNQTDVKAPETNRAMITLANGQKVYLDSAANGSLAIQGNTNLIKTADGKITYSHEGTKTQSELVYNTLSNPRGSKVIDMTLADGSRVWLNAGSSVTYPVAFIGNERKVSITGEAYFEISHNANKPFKVSKGDMEVTVLGTHFNVNAYDDESDIKVTLLEGSVKVSKGAISKLIKPGQQAVFTHDSRLTTHHPDLDEVMAWKNGYFYFSNADIGAIMRQVQRWYDVEVVYEGEKPSGHYAGEVPRNVSASEMLQVIKTSGVNFRIEGKKVIVMK